MLGEKEDVTTILRYQVRGNRSIQWDPLNTQMATRAQTNAPNRVLFLRTGSTKVLGMSVEFCLGKQEERNDIACFLCPEKYPETTE